MSRVLPILFNTDMVRAILGGRKTVTRRLMKPQLPDECPKCMYIHNEYIYDTNAQEVYCASCGEPLYKSGTSYKAPYQPGDILYVRETWCDDRQFTHDDTPGQYFYRADSMYPKNGDNVFLNVKWCPSIHMPKEAARIWLKVVNVRVERLQDITEEQALSEGVPDDLDYPISKVYCPHCRGEGQIGALSQNLGFMEVDCPDCYTAVKRFKNLWNSTIKKYNLDRYGWDANPWVWVIEFERREKPEIL